MVDGPERFARLASTADLSRRAWPVLRSWRSRRAARSCIIAWVQVPIRELTRSRGESRGRSRCYSLAPASADTSSAHAPHRRLPADDGPTTGSRFPGLPRWRSGFRPPSRRRRSLRMIWSSRRGCEPPARGACRATTLEEPSPNRTDLWRLVVVAGHRQIDSESSCPLPLRAPLDARLGSPSDQDRRYEQPVRTARTHEPRRLRRVRPPHARDPYGTQATEPARRCFRRQRRLRMQIEERVVAKHDPHPILPHRSHSPSLRGPRHLAESLGFVASQVTRSASCLSTRCVRSTAMRSTDFCHPNQSTASTHVSCVPSFFSGAFASCLLERVGTLR